jgi:hypothetical protein
VVSRIPTVNSTYPFRILVRIVSKINFVLYAMNNPGKNISGATIIAAATAAARAIAATATPPPPPNKCKPNSRVTAKSREDSDLQGLTGEHPEPRREVS